MPVAPAIAAVLWVFLFNPSIGIVGYVLRRLGVDWNYLLNGEQAMLLIIIPAAGRRMAGTSRLSDSDSRLTRTSSPTWNGNGAWPGALVGHASTGSGSSASWR